MSTSYEIGELLGRGGMGEVWLVHDPEIGRDVALKRMHARDLDPGAVARFVREARIQARLDHPAIVPVHEIGYDADGRPYFTMKRLAGHTLTSVLEKRDASQQRLLRVVAEVCLAIDLAHSRGIIHRDLKPSNIMLGDYGEVYVIDWGVARVLDDRDVSIPPELGAVGETQRGAALGTPGYMAPEQARAQQVTTAVDVYALGSILFEILAAEPLHPRSSSSSSGPDASTEIVGRAVVVQANPSPVARRPDRSIAPELDAICTAALADDPAKRPSAHELSERIQHYLDGDRDLERRRVIAGEQLAIARAALASNDPARRGEAVHAAGRALALDPTSVEAAELVTSLIVVPPRDLPAEVDAAVHDNEQQLMRDSTRRAMYAYIAFLAFLTPVIFLLDVIDWPWLVLIYATILANLGQAWFNSRYRVFGLPELGITFALTLVFSRVTGPFVLTPILICAMMPALSQIPWVGDRSWALVAWVATAGIMPFALEWLGVFSPTWEGTDAGLLSTSAIFDQRGSLAMVVTVLADLLFLVVIALYVKQVASDRRSAERRLHIQMWHLRQLLPRYGVAQNSTLPSAAIAAGSRNAS